MIIALCLIAQVTLCLYVLRSLQVARILAISIVLALAIWYMLPGVIVLALPYEEIVSLAFGVSQERFVQAYFWESVAVCLMVYIFPKTIRGRQTTATTTRTDRSANLLRLALFFYAIAIIGKFQTGSFNYLQNNSAALYEERGSGAMLVIAYSLLSSATLLFAIITSSRSLPFYLAMALIVLDAFLGIMAGGRIALLGPMLVLVFRHSEKWQVSLRSTVLASFVGTAILFVVLPASSIIQSLRNEGTVSLAELHQIEDKPPNEDVSSMLFDKFDSFSTGAILLDRGGMGTAGLMPYYGSVLVFMPRAIFPWRPVAGSADGTIYGHPSRLVPAFVGIVSDALNVGIAPLHIALWQLGILGFPILVIAGSCYLLFVNHLLVSPHVWSRVVAISLLNIPAFSLVFPSPDIILKQCTTAFFLLAGAALVRRLRRWG